MNDERLDPEHVFKLRRHVHNTLVTSGVFTTVTLEEATDAPLRISIPIVDSGGTLYIHVEPSYTQGARYADCMRIKYEVLLFGYEFQIKLHLRPMWEKSRTAWVYDAQTLILKTQKALSLATDEYHRREKNRIERKEFLLQAQDVFGKESCKLIYVPHMAIQIDTEYIKGYLTKYGDNINVSINPKIHISEVVKDMTAAKAMTQAIEEHYLQINQVADDYRLM